ncbi:MAG: hypothetical protein HY721_25115 [Planctomycetes bacterium]|nr:hypothetical protein [Planctomycetota bacterium]
MRALRAGSVFSVVSRAAGPSLLALATLRAPAEEAPSAFQREAIEEPPALRGVYDKPFLSSVWRRAHVGGYTELEYHAFEDGVLGVAEGFRMRRTNLFLFAEVTDTVRFGSEIELETELEERPSSDIEVAVEMAFVDWTIFEEFTLRGGALLVPLGRINVNHDGPVREITDRPLVSTFVLPTTLTEAGCGALGTVALGGPFSLSYEAYAVNGFNLLSEDGELAADVTEKERLLREGRTSLGGDVNGGIASTGRVSLRASRLLELGGSWHAGTYDEDGDNVLGIVAGDLACTREWRGVELGLEGEVALAAFERDDFAESAGVPDQFWGYYVQGSAGGMPAFLREGLPYVFGGQGARIAAVLRYDWVDLDKDEGEAIEPGVTFRPIADTVFKLSYKVTTRSLGLRDVPGRRHFDDDGIVFSLSTYF